MIYLKKSSSVVATFGNEHSKTSPYGTIQTSWFLFSWKFELMSYVYSDIFVFLRQHIENIATSSMLLQMTHLCL